MPTAGADTAGRRAERGEWEGWGLSVGADADALLRRSRAVERGRERGRGRESAFGAGRSSTWTARWWSTTTASTAWSRDASGHAHPPTPVSVSSRPSPFSLFIYLSIQLSSLPPWGPRGSNRCAGGGRGPGRRYLSLSLSLSLALSLSLSLSSEGGALIGVGRRGAGAWQAVPHGWPARHLRPGLPGPPQARLPAPAAHLTSSR